MQPTGDDLSDLALLQTYWRQSYVISTEIRTAGKLSSKLKFLIISNSATQCLKRKGILKDWRHKQMHGKDTKHHRITRSSTKVHMCWTPKRVLKTRTILLYSMHSLNKTSLEVKTTDDSFSGKNGLSVNTITKEPVVCR